MLFDSIQVVEGGSITNLVVASGTAYPSVSDIGELFFRTDNNLLYLYAGAGVGWTAIGTDASFSTVAQTGSYNDLLNKPDVSGHNTGDQTITLTGDVAGAGQGTFTATLATVNSAPITDGFRKITINEKGLVTSSTAVSAADLEAVLGFTPYNVTNPASYITSAQAPVQSVAGRTGNVTLAQSDVSGNYTGTITSGQVTTGLGFTPYNATNPASYITSAQAPVQSVAGHSGVVTLAQADITGLKITDAPTFAGVTAPLTGAVTGNASTATALQTGRVISISGDAAGSTATFDGTSSVTANVVLATVNSSPVTAAFQKVTVNGKGLVTATSVVAPSDITTALAYTPANKAGDTFSGAVVLAADPTQALGAATKQYVDNLAAGLVAKTAVVSSTVTALPAVTYANGTGGVGATLTASANGSLGAIGGYTPLTNDRILVKDQATQTQNGIYVVTNTGSAGSPFILTRAPEFDNTPTGEMTAGDFTYVQGGTLGGTQWVLTTPGTIVVGTNAITWSQLTGAGVVTAGTGIAVTGNQVSNTGVLSVTSGSGLSTNTSATGNVSITNTGVTSLTGTANQVTASGSTGAITLSLPQNINSGAAPTFVGTNFSVIPNAALSNSSVTLNGTAVSLGGSATITAAAGTLTGSTLATGVTTSSLTSVGTLSSLSVSGTATAGGFSGPLTGNVTGNVSGTASTITGVYSGTITSSQVTTGLGFTPYNSTNPNGYISSITSGNVTTALGFTPYNATNPNGYITSTGTAANISGTYAGTITSGQVTAGLGFTPYNATNPNSYISSSGVLLANGGYSSAADWNTYVTTGFGTVGAASWTGTNQPTGAYNYGILEVEGSGNVVTQRYTTHSGSNTWVRSKFNAADWQPWNLLLTQNNFNSYAPTLTGTGASGTWGINVTGSAASITGTYSGAISSGQVTTGLGFTPYNATNPSGFITSAGTSAACSGNAATASAASTVNGASGQMNGDGWWRSTGTTGWYSTTYSVGIYATEAGNVRTYNGANFISAGGLQGTSLGVGTAASGTTGEIRATNNITAYYSDDRLKTRTGLIENALDKVASLDAFYYHANETAQALGYDVHPEVGISAQQVQAIMPEVVAPAPIDDKYLTVRYERLVPLLIAAIKELQAEVELLKAAK